MKTFIAVLLVSSVSFAQVGKVFPAGDGCNSCTDLGNGMASCTLLACDAPALERELPGADPVVVADAPTIEAESPVIAPDVPEVSVRLRAGETAPFDGRLIALDENLRRGKNLVDCKAELAEAKTNEWVSKPVLIGIIVGAVALGAAAGAGVTAWALKK